MLTAKKCDALKYIRIIVIEMNENDYVGQVRSFYVSLRY